MKKLFIILVAALFAVSCSDKAEYTTVDPTTPIYTSLSYDTASKFASNAANRAKVYNISGKYIKFTVAYDESVGFYVSAGLCAGDEDANQLDAQIARIEGTDFENLEDIDLLNLPADDQFDMFAVLPDAATPVEGKKDTYVAEEKPAFIIRFQSGDEDSLPIYLAVVMPKITMAVTKTEKETVTSPFGEPDVTIVETYTEVADIYYKQFAGGKWL